MSKLAMLYNIKTSVFVIMRKSVLYASILLLYPWCITATFTSIRELAKQMLLNNVCLSSSRKQLARMLKQTSYKPYIAYPNPLFMSLHAMLKQNDDSYLAPLKQPLLNSFESFVHTPGYLKTLHLILSNYEIESIVKGNGYEIERAYDIHNQGEKIEYFNIHLSDGNTTRQIDIQTEYRCIECKNMHWSEFRNTKPTKKLIRQFLWQQALIALLRPKHVYHVSSKQTIPESWKRWFEQQQIAFHEEQQ